jgi:hypothetical protein
LMIYSICDLNMYLDIIYMAITLVFWCDNIDASSHDKLARGKPDLFISERGATFIFHFYFHPI